MPSPSTILAALLLAGGASLVAAAPADPPAAPVISSFTFSGNGCPQGSRNDMYGDDDSLNFALYAFNGRFNNEGRSTNCELHISLRGGAAGWQLSLESVAVRGTLREEPGSEVSFFTTAFWSATAADTITKERRISNPGSDTTTRDLNVRQQIGSVSPCGQLGILNVSFRAALTDGSGASFTATGDTPVTEELQFSWKRC